jgi:hypothetical protein
MFQIDFFELSFLAEACIPPQPIARTMFWQRLIDKIYYDLDQDQRDKMYKWMNRNLNFEWSLNEGNKDCQMFNARFDKENCFDLETEYEGKKERIENTFLWEGEYYTSHRQHIIREYITKIEKSSERK